MSAEDILHAIENPTEKQRPEWIPFYSIVRDENEAFKGLRINFFQLVALLKKMGFRRMDVGSQSFIVRIIDNVVEEASQKQVIDCIEDYINEFGELLPDGVMKEQLLNKLYRSLSTFFSDHILNRLRDQNGKIEFQEHSKDEAFFYYQNGFVRVTKEKIELLPYEKLTRKIWKNQMLQREFTPLTPIDYKRHSYVQFVSNIANNYHNKETEKPNDPSRFDTIKTVIGYLLHGYFEGKLKAVIFTDSRISDDASGRTGKTLLMKSLGHLLNASKHAKTFVEINGKDFDAKEKFKYQELAIDTRLVHINDASRFFNFEALFNDITEGIRAQRKNEMPFPVMAKMAISTNRTIRIQGDSSKDRCIEFEMADYYSADFSPEKEFRHWFFRDWSEHDWNCFDNFLMECCQAYLKRGLQRPEAINLLDRKLQEETALEFVEFMRDLAIKHEDEFEKAVLHNSFVDKNPDFIKLKRRTFTKWLRLYADYVRDFDSYEERRSSGQDFIKYLKTPEAIEEEAKNQFTI